MRDLLVQALKSAGGYVELRLRRRWSTAVVFRKQRLEVATEYHAFGGVARCLVPGHGWGQWPLPTPIARRWRSSAPTNCRWRLVPNARLPSRRFRFGRSIKQTCCSTIPAWFPCGKT